MVQIEEKLKRCSERLNHKVAQNRKLYHQIDELKQKHDIFDDICNKLETKLASKAQEISSIIHEANIVCENRDRTQSNLNDLKQVAEDERQEFEKEWEELRDLVEEERQLQEMKLNPDKLSDGGRNSMMMDRRHTHGHNDVYISKNAELQMKDNASNLSSIFCPTLNSDMIDDLEERTKMLSKSIGCFETVKEEDPRWKVIGRPINDIKKTMEHLMCDRSPRTNNSQIEIVKHLRCLEESTANIMNEFNRV